MHLFDQRLPGILALLLLAFLVAAKRLATGSVLDKPTGGLLVQLVNVYNLFFLLVVNPVAAVLLILRRLPAVDPTHLSLSVWWLAVIVEVTGLVLFAGGFLLMVWALITLRANYQLGGSKPRSGDELVVAGPYKLVRHPMYTSVLGISLGMALLI